MHRILRQRRLEAGMEQVRKHASPKIERPSGSREIEGRFWLTLSYVTWKRTSFPVPKGSRNRNVPAAIIAQKKLTCYVRDRANYLRSRKIPSPHDLEVPILVGVLIEYPTTNLRREEIRYFFQTEEYATNGSSECHCNSCSACSAEHLTSFAYEVCQMTKEVN